MRVTVLVGLAATALVALSMAATKSPAHPFDPPAEKSDDAMRAKVRELEERLARVEKQVAGPALEALPFGDVVVNLNEDRFQRYLRIKIAFLVEESASKEMAALMVKRKAELKSWAIAHLAGQTLKDVSGSSGVAAVQEALKKGFGEILAPGARKNPITNVLFEEYVVQ